MFHPHLSSCTFVSKPAFGVRPLTLAALDARGRTLTGVRFDVLALRLMLNIRMLALGVRHFSGVAVRLWKILRALFQEVIGFTFFVFAAWGALWLARNLRQFEGDGEALFKIVLVAVFVVMMAGFGISSFRRARRISRSR